MQQIAEILRESELKEIVRQWNADWNCPPSRTLPAPTVLAVSDDPDIKPVFFVKTERGEIDLKNPEPVHVILISGKD